METPPRNTHPYDRLTPELILNAVEAKGYVTNGRLLALNSYENRVYQVGIEDDTPIIAKFYRPGRWSNEAILEEHGFTRELAEREIPVVAPIQDDDANSLFIYEDFRFALFPRRGGHWPELDQPDQREWIGRFMGNIHACGARKAFQHRITIGTRNYGWDSVEYIQEHGFIPADLQPAYSSTCRDVMQQVEAAFERAGDIRHIRLYGDCHPGNILWTDNGPHFVDFDDTCMGPAIQDLWMLLSGDRHEMTGQLMDYLEGYTVFHDFDPVQLQLIEPLRTLRLLHYSAWLARRWEDPAFPHSFPWFNTQKYWEEQILTLREQAARLQEPPLQLPY